MKNALWEIYGYIASSHYRKVVLKILRERPSMPKEIAQRSNKPQSHISRALKELEKKGIVKCINPNARKGKMYKLTDFGIQIANMLFRDV